MVMESVGEYRHGLMGKGINGRVYRTGLMGKRINRN